MEGWSSPGVGWSGWDMMRRMRDDVILCYVSRCALGKIAS